MIVSQLVPIVAIENSVEKSLTRPIPGVLFSMVNGHRELSQLDSLHIAFAGGRREILGLLGHPALGAELGRPLHRDYSVMNSYSRTAIAGSGPGNSLGIHD